jgi:hypothetical protein
VKGKVNRTDAQMSQFLSVCPLNRNSGLPLGSCYFISGKISPLSHPFPIALRKAAFAANRRHSAGRKAFESQYCISFLKNIFTEPVVTPYDGQHAPLHDIDSGSYDHF